MVQTEKGRGLVGRRGSVGVACSGSSAIFRRAGIIVAWGLRYCIFWLRGRGVVGMVRPVSGSDLILQLSSSQALSGIQFLLAFAVLLA